MRGFLRDAGFALRLFAKNRAGMLLPDTRNAAPPQQRTFAAELLAQCEALPGVPHAALAATLPSSGSSRSVSLRRPGQPPSLGNEPIASFDSMTPACIQALGMRRLADRGFTRHAHGTHGSSAVGIAARLCCAANGGRIRMGWVL
jgi:hypothetical protein